MPPRTSNGTGPYMGTVPFSSSILRDSGVPELIPELARCPQLVGVLALLVRVQPSDVLIGGSMPDPLSDHPFDETTFIIGQLLGNFRPSGRGVILSDGGMHFDCRFARGCL